jgi:SNF2 family DNA or RNA helicase
MKLWMHQQRAFDFALHRPASLIASGMGTGKTAVAIALADEWNTDRVLVLCPTTVRPVWRGQIAKHCARNVEAIVLDSGSIRQRTTRADRACRIWRQPFFIVANYEACLHEPFKRWVLGRQWDLTILDESQRVMRESKTAIFANELRKVSERRLCLSGTSMTQDPLSIFAQCRFLDPSLFGEDLEWFKIRFENRFAVGCRKAVAKCDEAFRKRGWPLIQWPEEHMRGTVNTDLYLEILSRVAFRCENSALDLPPLTIERRTFQLSDSARRVYRSIEKGHRYEIESGRWKDVQGSYATTMRLQQITSGFLPDDEGNPVPIDPGKAVALADIFDGAGREPIVVFTRFVHDLNVVSSLADKAGLRYAEISHRRKDGLSSVGMMPEGVEVCGVQEQAGGAGIDLTRARIGVFYSLSWSLADRDQALARIYRPPQPKDRPVIIYELVAEDSIDEELYRALNARKQIIQQAWDGFRALASPTP